MNWNLITVAFTIVALGLFATFDIIPGAGFSAGVAMLATGASILILQSIARSTLVLRLRMPLTSAAAGK